MASRIARRALVGAVLVATTVGLVAVIGRDFSGFQGKPIREDKIYTSFKAPPGNVPDMVLGADAVVRGRMVGKQPVNARTGAVRGREMTANHLQVIEILHNFAKHQVEPGVLNILRPSGDFDRGSHIERAHQVDFPEFQPGHEYLVFLYWNEALDGWVPAYGPDSVFDLTSNRPIPFGSSKVATALAAKSSSELLTHVRFLGR